MVSRFVKMARKGSSSVVCSERCRRNSHEIHEFLIKTLVGELELRLSLICVVVIFNR